MLGKLLLLVAAAGTAASCAAPAGPPAVSAGAAALVAPHAALEELLAAERFFSAAGAKVSVVDAIGSMLAEDAIMPAPPGVFAKGKPAILAALRTNPANATSSAEWAPVRGGISADGLHGFTYGFMTIREPGKPDRRAKYLSYWVKRPEGWRVALYKRAPSAGGPVSTAMRPPAVPARLVAPTPEAVPAHRASLAAAEKAFSDEAQLIGLGPAFAKHGSADAMNMGGGADFTFSAAAIGGGMPPDGGKSEVHWSADEGVLVASSGDLGVTWGFIRPHKAEAGQPSAIPFFTVWRRAGPGEPWRYVAE